MALTKLASNGRVVIPSQIRDALHLVTGDEFDVRAESGEIRLIPLANVVEYVQDYLAVASSDRSLADELIEERRSER